MAAAARLQLAMLVRACLFEPNVYTPEPFFLLL